MPPIVPSKIYMYPANTQVVEIDGLVNQITGAYQDSAQVSATLIDQYGNPADPASTNVPMNYVPSSNGNYQGIISSVFNPPLGSGYILQIKANPNDPAALWSILVEVKLRPQ